MKLLRHKELRGSRGFIRVLAAMMFCLVLSIGTVCYADEVAATVTVASAKIRASADPSSSSWEVPSRVVQCPLSDRQREQTVRPGIRYL